jgi:hypothetical protein
MMIKRVCCIALYLLSIERPKETTVLSSVLLLCLLRIFMKQTLIGSFTTIFGNFFGNYINIFQKIEIQTIILSYLVSQNLNWIKSYDII